MAVKSKEWWKPEPAWPTPENKGKDVVVTRASTYDNLANLAPTVREAILAKRVIDATGDADVAHRAGAPTRRTPREDMMAVSVMFHMAGVDKRAFMAGIAAEPQTYRDWAGNGEWDIETSGKEDDMFSPFVRSPFKKAVADGVIPAHLSTLAGTWGAMHDSGELTYMNVIHLAGIDGLDPDDLTRGEIEGRAAAMHALIAQI